VPVWLVRATWIEDEVEASETWEVNADAAHDAIKQATMHIRFQPHHVEAKLLSSEEETRSGLRSGQARRASPQ
jgi:hypothetical protein